MSLDTSAVRRLALGGLFLALAVLAAPDEARADHCSYCQVEWGTFHTCCGDQGQAICAGITTPDDCSTCRPGLRLSGLTCEPPSCSVCRATLGYCCGGLGQVPCTGECDGTFCGSGLTLRGVTCEIPCSYCTTPVTSCCGDSGQLSCERLGIESGCNPTCKDGFFRDDGYISYVGTAVCQPEWQAPADTPPADGFDFTFFVATDVHIGYPERSECYPESAYDDMTRMINDVGPSGLIWPTGYEKAGQPIGHPLAVVMTGDITVHGGDSPETSLITEMTRYRDYWEERRRDDDNGPSVNYPVYPGLGNHDLAEGCHRVSADPYCTRQLTKNNISKGYIAERMEDREGIHYDEDSTNYSWDWGGIHFIQGHLWAGKLGGLQWLRDDLAAHAANHRPVVLFQHYGWSGGSLEKTCHSSFGDLDYFDPLTGRSCNTTLDCPGSQICDFSWWSDQDRLDLKEALAGYNVVGIFAGHTHTSDWMPAKTCTSAGVPKACTSDLDCPGYACVENTAGPGFDVFTGEDGGQDDNCEDDKTAGRTPEGDGGFLAVRFADKGTGVMRMEVLQLRWAAPISSASGMTHDDIGSFYTSGTETRLFPAVSRLTASPPVARCAARTVAADGSCRAAASVNDGSFDPDGPAPVCTASPAGPYALGATPVTLSCTDAQGLSDSCAAAVTVRDQTEPHIACAPPQVAECTASQHAVATFGPAATDNCDATPALGCAPASGTSFALGTHPVHCTATDDAGNQGACDTTVTVRDTTAPLLACPRPQAVECTGDRHAPASYRVTASDECWGVLIPGCTPPSGSSFALGTTPVACSVTDGSSNSTDCGSSVTVVDTTQPSLTCPASQTVECTGNRQAVAKYQATASDVCWGTLPTACHPSSGTSFPVGTSPVTCDATDGSGLTGSCPSSVTVADTIEPVVTCGVATPSLWPANHALVPVGLTAKAIDVCDGTLPVSVRVFSNQDDEGEGFSPDAADIAVGTLRLRRERAGTGKRGRVYLVVTSATDGAGNGNATCCAVTVPHDNSAASQSAVAQDAAAAMAACRSAHGVPPPGFVPVGDGAPAGGNQ